MKMNCHEILFSVLLKYSPALLYHGKFSHNSSQQTSHRSPMTTRYGVSFVSLKSDLATGAIIAGCLCNITIYWTAL